MPLRLLRMIWHPAIFVGDCRTLDPLAFQFQNAATFTPIPWNSDPRSIFKGYCMYFGRSTPVVLFDSLRPVTLEFRTGKNKDEPASRSFENLIGNFENLIGIFRRFKFWNRKLQNFTFFEKLPILHRNDSQKIKKFPKISKIFENFEN